MYDLLFHYLFQLSLVGMLFKYSQAFFCAFSLFLIFQNFFLCTFTSKNFLLVSIEILAIFSE